MAETKKKKKAKRERKERRFSPEQTYSSNAAVGVGMLGALAAGRQQLLCDRWTTSDNAALGCSGFMNAALGVRAVVFFADLAIDTPLVGIHGLGVLLP